MSEQLRRSRIVLYGVVMPILGAGWTLTGTATSVARVAYVLLGFSLIIFFHEFGHFVVARLCGVKCLAFSLGIGPRAFGWRKGGGLTVGADRWDPDVQAKKNEKKEEKTPGEKEDEKNALKELPAEEKDTLRKVEAATVHSDLLQASTMPPLPAEVGDTDYRVSWLPLGGYVRMLGQDDMDPTKVSMDPRAFNQRPIWQRMLIVSAGVAMNILFAAVVFSIIFRVGVSFPPAQIGQVEMDSPAGKAGLHMGDEIVAIDGERPRGKYLEFTDVSISAALASKGEKIKYEYIPYGSTETKSVELTPAENAATGFLSIGIEPMPGLKIVGAGEEAAVDKPGNTNKTELGKVRDGDEIVAVDGEDVRDDYIKLYNHIQAKDGVPVTVTLENTKNKALAPLDIKLTPQLERRLGAKNLPPVLGLAPRTTLGEYSSWRSAAKAAGLKEGDQVLRVGDRTNPTVDEFRSVISANSGTPVEIVVWRGGEEKTLKATPEGEKGKGLLGIYLFEGLTKTTFYVTDKGSGLEELKLPEDAKITAIDGEKVENWGDVYGKLRRKEAGTMVAVTISKGTSEVTQDLAFSADDFNALKKMMHYQLGVRLENRTRTQIADSSYDAVMMGMEHTKKFILQVYMTLGGLFRGTVSASNLHGMLGITKVGYDVQERGTAWFWYLMAMVSVNLAVANFLPLPIVDGGLFLLLILERVRGKPLSLKVQSAIQMVGIVLLAGVFLLVTWNDLGLFRMK